MPGLVAFGRRWGISSDDLLVPALGEIIIRVAWLISVSIVYELHHGRMKECEDGYLLQIYTLGVVVLLIIVIVLNAAICFFSMQGSIMFAEPRRRILPVLYTRAGIVIPEIIWNVLGTYWVFAHAQTCPGDMVLTIKVTVIFGWCLLWILMLAIAIIFDPLGNEVYNAGSQTHIPSTHRDAALRKNWALKVWETRCHLLCCCMGDDHTQDAYANVAKHMAHFFQDIDLVPSDIAASFVLLHRQERQNFCHVFEPPSTGIDRQVIALQPERVPSPSRPDWMTAETANYYLRFAVASYGCPLYMYLHCTVGLCRLYDNLRCCGCARQKPGYIVEDNCCQCHTAALQQLTGLTTDDLIYVSFHNRTYEVPFYVAIDHQTSSIVIAIRGTLSLADVLTDLCADSVPIEVADLPPAMTVHCGMLHAARFVHQRLVESGALNDALAMNQNYKLVVTGHSLGGSTAAILAILLRPSYPSLRCFAYSPSGAVMSREMATYTEEFIMSVVVGYDLVMRLNLATLEELKRRMMRALYACHHPKYRVLISECFSCCFGPEMQNDWSTASTPAQSHPLLETDTTVRNHTYESLSEVMHTIPALCIPSMYAPGCILHIEEIYSSEPGQKPTYTSKWVQPESFNRIIVMPQMLTDHTPYVVMTAMQQIVNLNDDDVASVMTVGSEV